MKCLSTYVRILEIEAAIAALGREPGGGLVVIPDITTTVHRAPIILAAARNNLPTVYGLSFYARDGGLLSYGNDPVDMWRRAATYVDRILRGAIAGRSSSAVADQVRDGREPHDRQGAWSCDPPSILLRADEVIEE
jgi:putative ABC transport system substrate-binding protein